MKTKFSFLIVLLLTLVIGIQPAIAKKPLTIYPFDEATFLGIDDEGVGTWITDDLMFEYHGSGGCLTCSGEILNMETDPDAELTITFEKPTTVVEFEVAISAHYPVADGIFVDVYGPGQSGLRESFVVPVLTLNDFGYHEGYFAYDGAAVKKVVLHFLQGQPWYGFTVDNLVYHG